MYTIEALLDLHKRAHGSFQKLLTHCSQLSTEELNQELQGFGYPTVRLQLHHILEAEKYWIGVLEGRIEADDNADDYSTIKSLEAYRKEVFKATEHHLRNASEEEFNIARPMMTWNKGEQLLKPAHILLRTQTHIYQHQGQILAMCRLLGKPGPAGLDFPIT